ncbi:MAG: GNAT family N-acetyltransferase [Alkalibacterium sp.]|nr:GNAT family N-acetyltransferase [Alkalibacterium sp.]
MIYELSEPDFFKCKRLLNPEGQVEVKAIISGPNQGRVFVDDLSNPKTGLVWLGNNDGFFFIGDEDNGEFNDYINDFIDTVIKADAQKVDLNWFEGMGNHSGWDRTLDDLFKHRKTSSWKQIVYSLKDKHDLPARPQLIPKTYQLKDITPDLYFNNDYAIHNISYLQSKIDTFWSSPSDFFENGLGYCIVGDNKVVSLCFSSFVYKNTHCIDIETLSSHQNKQLAQFAAYAFVQRCLYENLLPYWDCMESNTVSQKVAEKIGLSHSFSYKGIEFQL